MKSSVIIPKRKIKGFEKMTAVLDSYFTRLIKPKSIAKDLQVRISFVYKTVELFKKMVKKNEDDQW